MAPPKGRICRQNNVDQDESVMLQPRKITTEDHPRATRAQNFIPHRGSTSTTRTQVGRRIMHKEQAPTVRHSDQRHGNKRSVRDTEPQPTDLIQKKAMDNQLNQVREDIRVEKELMIDSTEQQDAEGSDTQCEIMIKETRGPTYMQTIWGRPSNLTPIHVVYNEFGQPIGGESSKLSHFLGSIARNGKYCPIDIKNWHAMPRTNKTDMMDVVKLRFYVSAATEKWILTSIASKWRNWKHFLKTRYWADVPIEHLIDDTDSRVLHEQWVRLITYWRSEEAKKASDRNTKARKKKKMNQRTGKTSFAQIKARLTKEKGRCPTRVELFGSCFVSPNGNSNEVISATYSAMQERSNHLLEGSEDAIAPNDVFAQIMGKDKLGHVRMLGQGICPSDIWSETPRVTSDRLIMEQQEEIERLKGMLLTQKRSLDPVIVRQDTPAVDSSSPHATTTQSLQVGTYVSLESLFSDKVVAKGFIQSIDPSTKVGGQILGVNWCEVNVKVIVEPDEQLVRPYDTLQKISHTLGQMIAWPCSLVTPTESR